MTSFVVGDAPAVETPVECAGVVVFADVAAHVVPDEFRHHHHHDEIACLIYVVYHYLLTPMTDVVLDVAIYVTYATVLNMNSYIDRHYCRCRYQEYVGVEWLQQQVMGYCH